jgi:hypothetical protein
LVFVAECPLKAITCKENINRGVISENRITDENCQILPTKFLMVISLVTNTTITVMGFALLFIKLLLRHFASSENSYLYNGMFVIKYANKEVNIMLEFDLIIN